MAQVFQQALGPQGPSPYELALAELAKQQPAAAPMYTPEQVQQRIQQNNSQTELGLLGQLSGDSAISGIGGSVLKQALAARNPVNTTRGQFNPITGETAVDPAWAEQQHEARQGKVLTAALNFENQRTKATEQQQRDQEIRNNREDMIRLAASLKTNPGGDPGGLKQALLQARIDDLTSKREGREEKAVEGQRKIKMQAEHAVRRATFLSGELDKVDKMIGPMTTGLIGSQTRKIPGTEAYNLNKLIDTIKANIGFEELRQMRLESPTGGALGQVAIKELDMLQATLGNLDTAQDADRIKEVVKQLKTHFGNIAISMKPALVEAPAAAPPTDIPGAPAAPGPGPGAAAPSGGRERTATHPQTGQKLVLRNGQWVPLK